MTSGLQIELVLKQAKEAKVAFFKKTGESKAQGGSESKNKENVNGPITKPSREGAGALAAYLMPV
jgi:hypothetical protein